MIKFFIQFSFFLDPSPPHSHSTGTLGQREGEGWEDLKFFLPFSSYLSHPRALIFSLCIDWIFHWLLDEHKKKLRSKHFFCCCCCCSSFENEKSPKNTGKTPPRREIYCKKARSGGESECESGRERKTREKRKNLRPSFAFFSAPHTTSRDGRTGGFMWKTQMSERKIHKRAENVDMKMKICVRRWVEWGERLASCGNSILCCCHGEEEKCVQFSRTIFLSLYSSFPNEKCSFSQGWRDIERMCVLMIIYSLFMSSRKHVSQVKSDCTSSRHTTVLFFVHQVLSVWILHDGRVDVVAVALFLSSRFSRVMRRWWKKSHFNRITESW